MNYSKTFQVGRKDNERYNLYSMKNKTMIMGMIVFFTIAVMVTLVQVKSRIIILYALLIGTGLGLVGIVLFIAANLAIVKYKLFSAYKSGKIKPFKQHIVMNESGVHAKTENGTIDVPFKHIVGVQETKQAYYIYITAEHTYVFPKDQMKGETEFQKVRSIFKANMPSGKLKLKT
jgi:hypothetical protein